MKRIVVVADSLALETPAQQLLDRFLLGYPRDGEFHRAGVESLVLFSPGPQGNPDIERRVKDHNLNVTGDLPGALTNADGVMVIPHGADFRVRDNLVGQVLEIAPNGSSCFIHGLPGSTLALGRRHAALAVSRHLQLLTGTTMAVTWRLPEIVLEPATELREALIVVQGPFPAAEIEALDGILPLLEARRGGETGVLSVRCVRGNALWNSKEGSFWSKALLDAALSRSDSPQGDPVQDGRTQDLLKLDLIPKLARDPRAWAIEHRDGLRTAILVLDGVIADYTLALQLGDGRTMSAQLFRPPKPAQHQFSRLAAVIEEFFQTRTLPWLPSRGLLSTGLIEAMQRGLERPGLLVETPDLLNGGRL